MTTSGSLKRQTIAAVIATAIFAVALFGLRQELAAAGAPAEASRASGVEINHFAYHPPTLTIAKGSKVTFSNTSHVTHTATSPGNFSTGHIKPGTSASIKFNHAGTFSYHCLIHHFMHGKIIVQ